MFYVATENKFEDDDNLPIQWVNIMLHNEFISQEK